MKDSDRWKKCEFVVAGQGGRLQFAFGGAGMLNVEYPYILELFPEHLLPGRTESAAFLIWYLQNYYRLDEVDAIDAVCDQKGDKGKNLRWTPSLGQDRGYIKSGSRCPPHGIRC